MSKVVIIGGGAASMLASIFLARNGHEVIVFEKNEKLGKKLYITGKGRCNITNASDMDILFSSIISNEKFLYSSFYSFTNEQAIEFFNEIGISTKVERGNRVFPASDKAFDVITGMEKEMKRLGVKIHLNTEVDKIECESGKFSRIVLKNQQKIEADACIVASGGKSYPTTGSTGAGYRMAKELGHKVTELYPALVPLVVQEHYVSDLQGLSLKNVQVTVKEKERILYQNQGEMLFTHFGLSGPLILSGSSYVTEKLNEGELDIYIDLKPSLSNEQLDKRLLRDFQEFQNKQFKNALSKLLPQKLIPIVIMLSEIDNNKKVNEISKEERLQLLHILKNMHFTAIGTRGFKEAIITKGGIDVKEISPSSLESKLYKNLYFIGEVLDLDALTGGFNLQIAWSTAYLAALNIE